MKLIAPALLCLFAFAGGANAQIGIPGQTGAPPLSYQAPILRYQPPRLEYVPPKVRQPATGKECEAASARRDKRRDVRRCVTDAPKDPAG